ncbi:MULTISPECIES: CoA pyrophosphatase [unclassified Aureispira]|uniref:NUDIX hydrolase n=1 Tax=unclassified Aureispira TaxID=2649989 RepID=UPI000697D093|nr:MULTISPECIES: CoA pyrophosphatase [unclassified Aureispira]WMX13361.1 CoA pyrophosphatase [Aureispira sp. CCB-E]
MLFIPKLKEHLLNPLPGIDAQLKMMSSGLRKNDPDMYVKAAKDARKACVLLLLFQKEGIWHTALMERPETPYAHSKQISFPGGGLEASDATLEAAALRETEEEFGIPREDVTIIGRLSQLYIPVSRYLVHPFVGYLKEAPVYTPDPKEVAEVIEVRIEDLIDPTLRKLTKIKTSSGLILRDVPYFDLKEKIVWGATAMMLNEFSEILETLQKEGYLAV